jgi:hypothetical protein
MVHYRAGRFQEAAAAFQQGSDLGLNDKLTQVFLLRCAQLIENPPADWKGVLVMTTK